MWGVRVEARGLPPPPLYYEHVGWEGEAAPPKLIISTHTAGKTQKRTAVDLASDPDLRLGHRQVSRKRRRRRRRRRVSDGERPCPLGRECGGGGLGLGLRLLLAAVGLLRMLLRGGLRAAAVAIEGGAADGGLERVGRRLLRCAVVGWVSGWGFGVLVL